MKNNWLDEFTEREQKEIDFALLYAENYAHGTPGHTHLMIIAQLARLLDEQRNLKLHHEVTSTLQSLAAML